MTDARPASRQRQLDDLAAVYRAKRDVLLNVYRDRLPNLDLDLEDCFGQATVELVAGIQRGSRYQNRQHLANALEQRFQSRITDRQRANAGRSSITAALAHAAPLEEDIRLDADPADIVQAREQLQAVTNAFARLSPDQRTMLARQVLYGETSADVARNLGWSLERGRKISNRGRARLRQVLTAEREVDQRPPWTRRLLGPRPHTPAAAERWDRAVRAVAMYRAEHDVTEPNQAFDSRSSERRSQAARRRATDVAMRAARSTGHDAPDQDHGIEP